MNRLALIVVGCLALPAAGWADVVHLKDGTRLEGDLKRVEDGYTITGEGGKVTRVTSDRVESIEVKSQGGADASMSRLQSLRRAADKLPDVKTVIDRYQAFITQNAGTPAAEAAKADLDTWRDRQAKGMVKVGDQWVSAAERSELRGKSSEVAVQLHDLLKQGRIKEATAALDKALQIDPQNMSLQYLRGVAAYQQDQFVPARKAFEAVLAQAPDHAPSMNNLAVTLWRVNVHGPALGYYERALTSAPDSRQIVDNIAEALNSLPKEQRDTPLTKKLVRKYKEVEGDLKKTLAARGLHRWGSTWVDDKDLSKLEAAEKEIKDQIKQLETDFDAITSKITAVDHRIVELQQEMQYLDSQSVMQGNDGRYVRLPLPPTYFEAGRKIDRMKQDRTQMVADQQRLRQKAKDIQKKAPIPKFTGVQKIIDADGMPMPAPAKPAATQPAK